MTEGKGDFLVNNLVTSDTLNSPRNQESLHVKSKAKKWEDDCEDAVDIMNVDAELDKVRESPYTCHSSVKKSPHAGESQVISQTYDVTKQSKKINVFSEALRTDVLTTVSSEIVTESGNDQTHRNRCENQIIIPDDLILPHSSIILPIVACHEEIEASLSDSMSCPAVRQVRQDLTTAVSENVSSYDMSPQERVRRERVRQRKMAQRQNAAFKDRERLRAKERMKALRNDPVYRYHERQRDRERRKMARLNNQAQRAREREKDRVRKSLTRSLNCDKTSEDVDLNGFQLLLGVSDSEEEGEKDEGLGIVWGTE